MALRHWAATVLQRRFLEFVRFSPEFTSRKVRLAVKRVPPGTAMAFQSPFLGVVRSTRVLTSSESAIDNRPAGVIFANYEDLAPIHRRDEGRGVVRG